MIMSAATTQSLLSKPTILINHSANHQELWKENLNMQMTCRECKEFPPNLVEEFSSGDMVCGSCGLVLGDRIVDTRSEWRTFSNDDQGNDDPSRVGDGANPLLNGSQLQTSISFGDGSSSRTRDLHRAQNKSTHDKSTKGLLAAYKEIGALCDAMSIPKNVSDTAKHIFKMVNDAGAFRGKSQDTIIAGSIFIACRQCKVPRTFREICALTKVSKAEIGRIFKALEKFFAMQNKERTDGDLPSSGRLKYHIASVYLMLTKWKRSSCIYRRLQKYENNRCHRALHTILQSVGARCKVHIDVSGLCYPDGWDWFIGRSITSFSCWRMYLHGVSSSWQRKDRQGHFYSSRG